MASPCLYPSLSREAQSAVSRHLLDQSASTAEAGQLASGAALTDAPSEASMRLAASSSFRRMRRPSSVTQLQSTAKAAWQLRVQTDLLDASAGVSVFTEVLGCLWAVWQAQPPSKDAPSRDAGEGGNAGQGRGESPGKVGLQSGTGRGGPRQMGHAVGGAGLPRVSDASVARLQTGTRLSHHRRPLWPSPEGDPGGM